ncbi:MAG: hypothetical protein ACAH65_03465 [Chloroflexota bacterium]
MPSRTGLAIDIAVKAATVGLLAWAVANPDLPQFQGKAFIGRAIAYPIVLLVVPVAWWLLGRRRIPFPLLPDILIGLPFLIDVAGNALDLYDTVESWDDLNHLVNWGLHTAGIGLLLRYSAASPGVRAALAFEWAVTSAVLWEFAEYVTFVPGSPEAVTAYADTLGDIALGMVGGLVAAILTARLPAIRQSPSAAPPRNVAEGSTGTST